MNPNRLRRILAVELAVAVPLLLAVRVDGPFADATMVPKLLVFRVACVFLLATLGALFLERSIHAGMRTPLLLAGAFLAWAFVTSLLGENPWVSLLGEEHRFEGWLGYVGYVAFWAAGRDFDETAIGPRWVAAGLAVLAAISGLALLQQFELGPRLLSTFPPGRSHATLGNPIYLGMLTAAAAPLLFARLLTRTARTRTAFTAGTAALLLAAVYYSYSRAAWLAVPVGLLLVLGLERAHLRRRWPVLVAVLAASAVLIAAVGVLRPAEPVDGATAAASRVTELATGGGTVGMRVEMYRGALALIAESPWRGRGFGTYTGQALRVRTERMVQIEGYQAYPDRPHDSLLYVAYATGLPGALLLAAFLLMCFRQGLRSWTRSSGVRKTLVAGAIGGAAAYQLAELTAFSIPAVTPVFWALLGWMSREAPCRPTDPRGSVHPAARAEGPGRSEPTPRRTSPFARTTGVVLLALALATCGPGLWQAGRAALADAFYERNTRSVLDPSAAGPLLERAAAVTRLAPYNSAYWNQRLLLLEEVAAQTGDAAYLAEAERAAVAALERLPDDPTLSVTYSDILLRRGRTREAIAFLEEYVTVDRYQADAHFNLGLAHLSLGEPAAAVRPLETATQVNPLDAEAYYHLSRAYRGLGRLPEADSAIETARGLDPDLVSRLEETPTR